MVVTFQPLKCAGGMSMAKFVLPQALGKGRRDVMFFPFRRFDAENEHVLGEPALLAREIGTDAEREAFLAEQNISAVTGADRDDGVVLRKMADEPAIGIHIEKRMHAAIPFAIRLRRQALARRRRPCAS